MPPMDIAQFNAIFNPVFVTEKPGNYVCREALDNETAFRPEGQLVSTILTSSLSLAAKVRIKLSTPAVGTWISSPLVRGKLAECAAAPACPQGRNTQPEILSPALLSLAISGLHLCRVLTPLKPLTSTRRRALPAMALGGNIVRAQEVADWHQTSKPWGLIACTSPNGEAGETAGGWNRG